MGQAKQRGTLEQRTEQSRSKTNATSTYPTPGEAFNHGWLLKLPRNKADPIIKNYSNKIDRLRLIGESRTADLVYLDVLLGGSVLMPKAMVGGSQICANVLNSLIATSNAVVWDARGVLPIVGCMTIDNNSRPHVFANAFLAHRHCQGNVDATLIELQDTLIHELVHASGSALGREIFTMTDMQHRREYITEEAIAIITSHCVINCIHPVVLDPVKNWKRMIIGDGYSDIESTVDYRYVQNEIDKIVKIIANDLPENNTLVVRIRDAIELLEQSQTNKIESPPQNRKMRTNSV